MRNNGRSPVACTGRKHPHTSSGKSSNLCDGPNLVATCVWRSSKGEGLSDGASSRSAHVGAAASVPANQDADVVATTGDGAEYPLLAPRSIILQCGPPVSSLCHYV